MTKSDVQFLDYTPFCRSSLLNIAQEKNPRIEYGSFGCLPCVFYVSNLRTSPFIGNVCIEKLPARTVAWVSLYATINLRL